MVHVGKISCLMSSRPRVLELFRRERAFLAGNGDDDSLFEENRRVVAADDHRKGTRIWVSLLEISAGRRKRQSLSRSRQLEPAGRPQEPTRLLLNYRRFVLKIKITRLVFALVFLAMSCCTFAQTRRTGSASLPCNATGSICVNGTPPASGPPTNPDAADTSDAGQQSIWRVAQQLGLTSDQRAQLDSSLKGQTDESAALDKALQNARAALAHALANGQTLLDAEIESLASANAKVQEAELKRWANLYAISTPEQQRQLLSMSTPLSLATASHGIMPGQ
jgi:Spy/CpxP family protein refolding chaperone